MKNFIRKVAVVASTLSVAVGGALVAAPNASAVGGCAANSLCLYAGTQFTDKKFTTGTVSQCWALADYGLATLNAHIGSWASTLPVRADVYADDGNFDWRDLGDILPGHFSSDTGGALDGAGVICTGGHAPYWP